MSRLLGWRANATGIAGLGVGSSHGYCLAPRPSARARTARLNHDSLALARGHLELQQAQGASVQPVQPVPARRSCRTACTADDATSIPTAAQGPPPLQVTRSNFTATLPAIKQALQSCQFFSFDCEMTGLFLPNQDDHLVDDVDDRYIKTAAAAEQFLVAQFGLSFFEWTDGGYEARSFNFHLFPSPNGDVDLRFMSQASALAFLASEGFDFNKMIYEGIPFLPLSWRDKNLNSAAAAATIPTADDLDEDEACFMSHLEQQISSWLASTAAAEDASSLAAAAAADLLYLPAPPPQFAKLQQRLLAAGIGSSRWRRSSSSSSSTTTTNSNQLLFIVEQPASGQPRFGDSSGSVMLRKATAQQVKEDAEFRASHRAEELAAATGFSQVFELIRDSQKPAVGHNIRFDLAYTLAAFVQSPLPKTWAGFKDLVGSWFPGGVYDTKYLVHCLTQDAAAGGGRLLMDTSLGACYDVMTQANPAAPVPLGSTDGGSSSSNLAEWLQDKVSTLGDAAAWQTLPAVHHAPGCEAYAATAAAAAVTADGGNRVCAHEAGYDAFMTGAVFVGLLRMFEVDAMAQRSRWQQPVQPASPPGLDNVQQYAWRQFFSKSNAIDYAALQGPEMVPNRPEVIYLTKFPPNTRWQDIQKRLAALHLGRPPVSMVRTNGHNTPATGAYVIFSSGKQAQKALQAIRGSKVWKVQAMTYSDYFFSKYGSSSSDSSSATAIARVPPAAVAAVAAAADEPAAAGDVVQQLQKKAAAARQRQQQRMEEQQQQQQQQQSNLLTNIMSSLDEEAEIAISSSNGSSRGGEPSPHGVDGRFTAALDGSSDKALAAAALLAERQRRLHLLQQQQQQNRVPAAVPPGAASWHLKRPPTPPAQ